MTKRNLSINNVIFKSDVLHFRRQLKKKRKKKKTGATFD